MKRNSQSLKQTPSSQQSTQIKTRLSTKTSHLRQSIHDVQKNFIIRIHTLDTPDKQVAKTERTNYNKQLYNKKEFKLDHRRNTNAVPINHIQPPQFQSQEKYNYEKRTNSLFNVKHNHNQQLRLNSLQKKAQSSSLFQQINFHNLQKNYVKIYEEQSLQQDIIDNKKFYLIIQNISLLENIQTAKYFYISYCKTKQINIFEAIKSRVCSKFNYSSNRLFYFQRNGRSINTHDQINYKIQTIVASSKIIYDELYGKKKDQIQKKINQLEIPIKYTNDYQKIQKSKFRFSVSKNKVNDVIQQLDQQKDKLPQKFQFSKLQRKLSTFSRIYIESTDNDVELEKVLVNKRLKKNYKNRQIDLEKDEIIYNFEQKELQEINKETIIEKNINNTLTKKSIKRMLKKKDNILVYQNIPLLLKKYGLTRGELFRIYCEYKVLESVTSEKYPSQMKRVDQGLDYKSYLHGNETAIHQAEELSRRHFTLFDVQKRGFMTWEQFLKLQDYLRARTFKDKLNVFCKTADVNQDGLLSYQEILELCQISLSKNFNSNNQDSQDMLQLLSVYFTRLIFQITNIEMDQEIPLDHIKSILLNEFEKSSKNGALLAMFCGVDM